MAGWRSFIGRAKGSGFAVVLGRQPQASEPPLCLPAMALIPPFWFNQRQAKAELTGRDLYRLTGPNLGETFIQIRRAENGRWLAALKLAADGPDVAVSSPDYETEADAWSAAFELYRNHIVI